MSLYKKILSQSWQTTWNNKYLWFFGLFAALLGGGEYGALLKGFSGDTGVGIFSGWRKIVETGIFRAETIVNIKIILRDDPLSLLIPLIAIIVILILTAFLIWLSIVSQGALVNNAADYLGNKKSDFKKGLTVGMKKFWPIFWLNAGVRILIYIVFIIIGFLAIPAIAKSVYIIAFIVFIPIAIILAFMAKYAVAYAVLKEKNLLDSIKNGWRLFIDNWLISLEMAFILFLINILIGLGLILLILTLTIPFLFLIAAFYKIASAAGFWFVIAVASVLFLAIIAVGGAILSTFQISAWTGLFLRLENKGAISKLVRIAESIKDKAA